METRQARDGHRYTQAQFLENYGTDWFWEACADTSDASQLAVPSTTMETQQATRAGTSHASQLAVRLSPANVVAVRREEAARGPPRSLHRLARGALNTIAKNDNYDTVNLDDAFPWIPYIAAHGQSAQIIGPGITHAAAVFILAETDPNRGGAPRLDFFFYRTDDTVCRVHPGKTSSQDAQLIFQNV
jgi:hypothetical protein